MAEGVKVGDYEFSSDQIRRFYGLDSGGRRAFFQALTDSGATQEEMVQLGQAMKDFSDQAQEIEPQVLESRLGAPVTNEGEVPLTTRFLMGRESPDTLVGRTNRVGIAQDRLPEGSQFRTVQDPFGRSRNFFRGPEDEGFTELNVRTQGVPEVLGGIANLETAASLGSSFIPGSLPVRAGRTALSAVLGNLADQRIDRPEIPYDPTQGVDAALFAGGGEVVGAAPALAFNRLTGRGRLGGGAAETERREVTRIIENDPALEPLSAGQQGPGILANLRARASQFGPAVAEQDAIQALSLRRSVDEIANRARSGELDSETIVSLSDRELAAVQKELEDGINRDFRNRLQLAERDTSLGTRGTDAVERGIFDLRGSDTARDIQSYREISKENIERAYRDVDRLAETEKFNIDLYDTQTEILKLRDRFPVQGVEGGVTPQFSGKMNRLLNQIEAMDSEVRQNSVVYQLRNGIRIPTQAKPFEAIRTIQKELGDFFGSDLEISAADEAAARVIRRSLSRDLDNITGSSGIVQALKRANKRVQAQHDILERPALLKLANEGSATKQLDMLYSGSIGFKDAQAMWRVMPKERQADFRSALMTDLMRSPGNIPRAMDNLARDGVGDLIVGKTNMDLLRAYSVNMQRLNQGAFRRLMEVPEDFKARSAALWSEGTPDEIRKVVRNMRAKERADFQASILEGIVSGAETSSLIGQTYDPSRFAASLKRAGEQDADKIRALFPGQGEEVLEALGNTQRVAEFYGLRNASSTGAGFAAGAEAGNLADIHNPGRVFEGILSFTMSNTIGRVLTWPGLRRWLNSSKEPLSGSTLRPLAVLSAEALKHSRKEEEQERQ